MDQGTFWRESGFVPVQRFSQLNQHHTQVSLSLSSMTQRKVLQRWGVAKVTGGGNHRESLVTSLYVDGLGIGGRCSSNTIGSEELRQHPRRLSSLFRIELLTLPREGARKGALNKCLPYLIWKAYRSWQDLPICGRTQHRKKLIVGAWNVRTLLPRGS